MALMKFLTDPSFEILQHRAVDLFVIAVTNMTKVC